MLTEIVRCFPQSVRANSGKYPKSDLYKDLSHLLHTHRPTIRRQLCHLSYRQHRCPLEASVSSN